MKKNFLDNKYKKQMCSKEYKSLFFDVTENGQVVPLEVCHFHHKFFLVEKWGICKK